VVDQNRKAGAVEEIEIEVTDEMAEVGAAKYLSWNNPAGGSPRAIAAAIFKAMAARQPEPEITDDAIDDAAESLLDFQLDRGDDPLEVTRNLMACALKGLKARRKNAAAR